MYALGETGGELRVPWQRASWTNGVSVLRTSGRIPLRFGSRLGVVDKIY